jgi:uncharacterized protein YceK
MTIRFSIAAVFLLATCLSGCATVGSKSDAPTDGDPEWLANLKALKGTGESTGVSREARDIEKSLAGH